MRAPNIEVSYEIIEGMTGEIMGMINGELGSTVSSYSQVGSGISKSSGEMIDAVKDQITAEQELAGAMAEACTQFVKSISNAAESFRGLDGNMAGVINLQVK